jgi:hypothetical protein
VPEDYRTNVRKSRGDLFEGPSLYVGGFIGAPALREEGVSRSSSERRLKSANYFRAFFLTTFFTAFLTAFLTAFAFFLAAIPLHLLLLISSSPLLTSFYA